MGDVLVKKGSISEGRITSLTVGFDGLPDREIDRATALRWMRDGHSFVPLLGGRRGQTLLLVEADEDTVVIRTDSAKEAQDSLPF